MTEQQDLDKLVDKITKGVKKQSDETKIFSLKLFN